jgi:hypothetical protein
MTATITKLPDPGPSMSEAQPGLHWPRRWWSGLAAGSVAGVMAVVWGLALWDQTTGWTSVDVVLWTIAGLLYLALFDGILSLLLWLTRGFARVFRFKRLSVVLRTWRTRYVSLPVAALWLSLGWVVFPDTPLAAVESTTTGALVILAFMAAGAVFGVVRGRWPSRRWLPAVLGLVPVFTIAAWLLWPGPGTVLSLRPEQLAADTALIADPGMPGSYQVVEFTYGSGTYSRRSDFGDAADVVTQPVDGGGIWDGFGGVAGWWWERYWGFGLEALPLNGLVWHPEGEGPFPLVLIVHGNHTASRSSDPGYEYLGHHLASRGFIAVSVDENFLNGTLLGDAAGAEMPLRGWLLLEHVAQWRRWNSDPEFRLYGQIDTEAVALIGHSRGGEAAVAATSMLNGSCGPGGDRIDPTLAGADIDAVVAIAPSDGLYRPCGSQARLRGTSYLTINGGMDGDVGTFYGLAQYGRARVQASEFKASAYLHRANHGQFNQSWGFGDLGVYDWLVLDRASLLTEQEQQQSARAIVAAFLEATLHDRSEYRDLFRRPDVFARSLPDDVLVTRYEDAQLETIEAKSPSLVTEVFLHETGGKRSVLLLRVGDRNQEDSARSISWQPGSEPWISYLLESPYALSPIGIVSVDLAAGSDEYVPEGISVTLHSASASATVPLDLLTAFRPPLGTELFKWPGMGELTGEYDWAFESERVLQTYELPVAAFLAANPDLDISKITAVDVTFDGRIAGVVLIDELGFRN